MWACIVPNNIKVNKILINKSQSHFPVEQNKPKGGSNTVRMTLQQFTSLILFYKKIILIKNFLLKFNYS